MILRIHNALLLLLPLVMISPSRDTPSPGQQADIQVLGAGGVTAAKIAAVRRLTLDALDWLAPSFPVRPRRFTVVVHASESSLPSEVRRDLHTGTAGVAMLAPQRIHLILDRTGVEPPGDLRTVVRHEVVHILLYQYAGPNVPRWFHEGLAQSLTGSTYLGASEEDIAFYVSTGNLPQFSKLRNRFPRRPTALRIAYAQSFSFVSFLQRRVGLPELLEVAAHCAPDRDFAAAFYKQVGRDLAVLEEEWREFIKTGSGAAWRVLLTSCFGLSMVAVLPLLVLAGAARWKRDLRSRQRLEVLEDDDSANGDGSAGTNP